MSCFVENRLVSVERIKQITNITSKAAWEFKDCIAPSNRPAYGNIDLRDLQVTGLQLILFNFSKKLNQS